MNDGSASCRRRILVVEDDVDIRESLAEALVAAGHQVHCAPDGASALDWLGDHPDSASTLIILDLRMPVMDGREFLKRLAQREDAGRVAVLVFTASTLNSRALLDAPLVRGVLTKPAPTDDILRTVAASWPDAALDAHTPPPW